MLINAPDLWLDKLPIINPKDNKYTRGYAVIAGSEISTGSTGATKLAAYAALRGGAGLVSISCTSDTASIYAASMISVMVKITETIEEYQNLVNYEKVNSILVGPGNGVDSDTKEKVLRTLKCQKPIVLDADAITVFKDNPTELFNAINSDVILTPHEGEFKRLFELTEDRIASVLAAAKISKATILLKGHETIIAAPSGEYIIHNNVPSNLATAGTGDVLAGLIVGFMAQGLDSFTSAAIACYVHSMAAKNIGVGLISEDLLIEIPKILKAIYELKLNVQKL